MTRDEAAIERMARRRHAFARRTQERLGTSAERMLPEWEAISKKGRETWMRQSEEDIRTLCAGPLPRAVLCRAREEFTEPERLEAACRRAARHSPQGYICWEGITVHKAAEVVEVVLAELDAEARDGK